MAIFGKAQPMQEMSDAERLAQIMQGNLAGQLSSGDKLSTLGALLKSVSRGSTTTPQQVIQNLQQQKFQEVQGRIQAAQLQRRQEALNSLPESERNMAALLDEKQLAEYLVQRQKGRDQTEAEKKLIAAGIDLASPEAQRILRNVASSQGIIPVTGPLGTTYVQASDVVFKQGAEAANTTIPQQAIDDLRSGKGTVEQFEQIFGKGSAKKYLGGGSGNATGGFRGR